MDNTYTTTEDDLELNHSIDEWEADPWAKYYDERYTRRLNSNEGAGVGMF